jgi:cell wall-associated NlpC family hydrolase
MMRYLLLLLILLLPAPWAAATDATDGDSAPTPTMSHDDMVVVALSLIGTPYKFGGTSPETGFDCSGLVQYVLGLSSPVTLPRNSDDMYRQGGGQAIALAELRAGDLLFFRVGKSQKVNHVAVYIGEDRFVHAPSQGGFVRVDKLDSKYWMRWFLAAKRVLPASDRLATNP